MLKSNELDDRFTEEGWVDLPYLSTSASQSDIIASVNTLTQYVNYLSKRSIGIE